MSLFGNHQAGGGGGVQEVTGDRGDAEDLPDVSQELIGSVNQGRVDIE